MHSGFWKVQVTQIGAQTRSIVDQQVLESILSMDSVCMAVHGHKEQWVFHRARVNFMRWSAAYVMEFTFDVVLLSCPALKFNISWWHTRHRRVSWLQSRELARYAISVGNFGGFSSMFWVWSNSTTAANHLEHSRLGRQSFESAKSESTFAWAQCLWWTWIFPSRTNWTPRTNRETWLEKTDDAASEGSHACVCNDGPWVSWCGRTCEFFWDGWTRFIIWFPRAMQRRDINEWQRIRQLRFHFSAGDHMVCLFSDLLHGGFSEGGSVNFRKTALWLSLAVAELDTETIKVDSPMSNLDLEKRRNCKGFRISAALCELNSLWLGGDRWIQKIHWVECSTEQTHVHHQKRKHDLFERDRWWSVHAPSCAALNRNSWKNRHHGCWSSRWWRRERIRNGDRHRGDRHSGGVSLESILGSTLWPGSGNSSMSLLQQKSSEMLQLSNSWCSWSWTAAFQDSP